MQVVVVGAGVVGLASAYFLAERGVDVTVLEKDSVAAGSTGRANGGIRAQFSTPESVALSVESEAFWDGIAEAIGFRRTGYLFCARTTATADRLRENVALQREYGVPSEVVTPEAARAIYPGLRADRYVAASHCPTDGVADPHLAAQWFAREATAAGATLRTGVEVTDLRTDGDRVVGVETATSDGATSDGAASGEPIHADCVVNAAGAWAPQVASMADLGLPISPRRRQLAVVEPERPLPSDAPLTADLDDGVHFRPEGEERAVLGGRWESADPARNPDAFEEAVDLDWAATAIDHAADCATNFGPDSRFVRGWAGLYAVTPDHHPVIEESRPGLVTAAGFSGHGFMHSPATGMVVAELVVEGESETVDVSRLGRDRFEDGSPLSEGAVLD